MLLSLFEVVEHAAEQNRRRFGGHRPKLIRASKATPPPSSTTRSRTAR